MLPDPNYLELERMLAARLEPLVNELRLTDLIVFVDHVVNGRSAGVAEIVAAAAELHYAPGFIGYDRDADIALDWSEASSVSLGISLSTAHFSARVRLIMKADRALIELQHVEPQRCDPNNTPTAVCLARAVDQNRLGRA